MADRSDDKSIPTQIGELWRLVLAYFRQETVEPVRNLGRFVAFGVAGSLVLGLGVGLLILAVLRFFQTETGSTFQISAKTRTSIGPVTKLGTLMPIVATDMLA